MKPAILRLQFVGFILVASLAMTGTVIGMTVLQQEAASLRELGYHVLLVGDCNAHVGSVNGQGVPGNNPDVHKNGQRFLDFLTQNNLVHINGALTPDGTSRLCDGLWTRQRGASRSIIDFAVLSSEHVNSVLSMLVDDKALSWSKSRFESQRL